MSKSLSVISYSVRINYEGDYYLRVEHQEEFVSKAFSVKSYDSPILNQKELGYLYLHLPKKRCEIGESLFLLPEKFIERDSEVVLKILNHNRNELNEKGKRAPEG